MKSLLLVLMLLVTTTSSVPSVNYSKEETPKTISIPEKQPIEEERVILASVPKGYPVDKAKVRCRNGKCSGFGVRLHPVLKYNKQHMGIDLSCPKGTIITATCHGVVSKVKRLVTGYGNHVFITSGQYATLYAHLTKILVKEGQLVSPGDTIGTVGATGLATGPHLHYEVHKKGSPIDPLPFLQ